MSPDSEIHLALPFTITVPAGRKVGFLFTDKPIQEIEAAHTLCLMIGSGFAWDPERRTVDCYTCDGLEEESQYVSVDWEDLGFDEKQQERIIALATRNGVDPPDRIYTFGVYWLRSAEPAVQQIDRVDGLPRARHLYTFEVIDEDQFVSVVRKRRQPVRLASPKKGIDADP